jgi:predicted DNA-binding transcriptional regulator AlpA
MPVNAQSRKRFCVKAAAEYVGISASTLNKLRCKSSKGPSYSKIGSRVIYDAADLDAWLEANLKQSTSQYIG